ncbi:MAG TPA: T9SS type A sorting domain-containing protein [Patescibacteria group bacterium]|nr:T9SS type A sorting domain-containing protein [Patescibacteria group bacterium]
MKLIHTIYCTSLIILAAAFGLPAAAQPVVDVANTQGRQGESVVVPVEIDFADILPDGTSSIHLRIAYRLNRLVFENVTGGTNQGGCAMPQVTHEPLTMGEFGFLTISCQDIRQSNDNARFLLQFRVIAGQDTSARIEPVDITLNGDTLREMRPDPGFVRFLKDEPLVFPTYPEDLGINSPNPFNVETRFFYSIDSQTNVRFKIFDHQGKMVFEENIGVRNRGSHVYTISPFTMASKWQNWNKSSGMYILVMETNDASYRRTFLYLK